MARQKPLFDSKRKILGQSIIGYTPNNDAFNKRKPNPDPLDLNRKIDWSKLDLSKIETMATSTQGLTAWDAIIKAKQEGKIIIPNQVHDRMLVETNFYETPGIKEGYWSWTGTLVIYTKPNTSFNDKLVYNTADNVNVHYSFIVDIPQQYIGKINSALIINHSDFDILSLGNNQYKLQLNENIFLLENFPKQTENWYNYDKQFRIPIGEPIKNQDNFMRYLWKVNSNYIGLLVRGFIYNRLKFVDASSEPSDRFGVHVIKKEDIPFSD